MIFSVGCNGYFPPRCRKMVIFPRDDKSGSLSMYLDVADSLILPYGWSRYVKFSLGVINQININHSVKKGLHAVL